MQIDLVKIDFSVKLIKFTFNKSRESSVRARRDCTFKCTTAQIYLFRCDVVFLTYSVSHYNLRLRYVTISCISTFLRFRMIGTYVSMNQVPG